MRISVVVPCHDGVEDTRRCLASLRSQRGAEPHEILIVDNASRDATRELDREFPGVQVLRQERNLGFAGGVNRGIAAARGELVLILNNDTVAAPHLLARLRAALLGHVGVAAVAPVSNHVKGPARLDIGAAGAGAGGAAAVEQVLDDSCSGIVEDVDTLAGLCLLARRTTLQAIGGFDERFGIGNFEDDDLCLRLRLQGLRLLIVRDAFLHHEGHATFRALGVDYRATLLERRAQFVAKWRHDPVGRVVIARLDGNEPLAWQRAPGALRRHPRWPDGWWLLARQATAQDRPRRALRHLEAFVAACPAHGEAQVQLALLRLRTGDELGGRRHLVHALGSLHLVPAAAARTLGRLAQHLAEGDDSVAAEAAAQEAVTLQPEDAELQATLGAVLLRAGEIERALPPLQRAEAGGTRYGASNLGVCLWRLGRHAEAMAAWQRAAELAPDDPLVQHNLALALSDRRRRAASAPAP